MTILVHRAPGSTHQEARGSSREGAGRRDFTYRAKDTGQGAARRIAQCAARSAAEFPSFHVPGGCPEEKHPQISTIQAARTCMGEGIIARAYNIHMRFTWGGGPKRTSHRKPRGEVEITFQLTAPTSWARCPFRNEESSQAPSPSPSPFPSSAQL